MAHIEDPLVRIAALTIVDPDKLGDAIDRSLLSDPGLRLNHRNLTRQQNALRDAVNDRQWAFYMSLEELLNDRLADAQDVVAKAFRKKSKGPLHRGQAPCKNRLINSSARCFSDTESGCWHQSAKRESSNPFNTQTRLAMGTSLLTRLSSAASLSSFSIFHLSPRTRRPSEMLFEPHGGALRKCQPLRLCQLGHDDGCVRHNREHVLGWL